MKKILSLLLAITMIVLCGATLTSCGGGAMPNFVVPAEGFNTEEEVTITFYHTMGENLRAVLDDYIVEFNKLYPNIKVVHEQVGGYDDVRDQISTEISVGTQPNIAYCYPDHVALYNLAGAVVTLDPLMESTITVNRADGTTETLGFTSAQVNDFIKGYYDEGRQFGNGLMYTLPFSKSTEVLYYNKTFFEEHDLKVPTTWAELEETCKKIKAIDPTSIPLGYDSEANWFITMCEQYGSDYTSASGDHYLFNNKTNKNFVKMFRSWYDKGYVTTQTIHGGYTSALFTETKQGETKSYMCIGSSAGASHQKPADAAFEVGITSVPQINPEKPKVISQGPSLCIFQNEDPQKVLASWLFVKFLTTSVEFQAEFSMESGYVPVLKSVAENELYAAFTAKADGYNYVTALSAKVCLEQQAAYYTSPAFNGSSTARTQVELLFIKCLSASADSYGGDVDKLINAAFKEAIEECEYAG
ncbi:MAG: extracellular solute-binding protein [Clostridia bacterium]|nr:extracellular solute-binding protein [Clostridia bacterium]